MYRYYLTKRPTAPGAIPHGAAYAHNYGANGTEFEVLGIVWGYAEYQDELSEKDVNDYELTPGPVPHYYPISEEAAARAKAANSWSDYIKGSATEEYRREIDDASCTAFRHKQRVDPMYHEKIDRLLDTFSRLLAENLNQSYSIRASCPSIMIAGGSNFPIRKKQKQIERDDRNMAEWREIQELRKRITSVGTGGISGGDPMALDKLKAKLDKLLAHQGLMKAANSAVRMKDTVEGDARLKLLGFSTEEIKELCTPDFCGRIGYPSYALSNNNANIRRIRERIAELEKRSSEPAPEGWTFDGGEVVVNTEENRLQIIFDGKPDPDTRAELKSNGFHWAPSQNAWQRQLTDNAIRAAKYMDCLKPV